MMPETVTECIRQLFQMHFPRSTIVNILRAAGHQNAEQLVTDVEDETVKVAVLKIR